MIPAVIRRLRAERDCRDCTALICSRTTWMGGTKMSKLEHIRPSGLHHNPASSHVVVASGARTIYIAGQVSTDDEGRAVVEGGLTAQTTQVMHYIGLALKAAGASYGNIVKITTFVVG